jgi:branched-chain amino acid transport system substrate-binding protein
MSQMTRFKFCNALKTFSVVSLVALSAIAQSAIPTVKVGIILPISGNTAAFGKDTLSGVKIAVEEINKNKEMKIELVVEDDKSSTTDAANAAKKLVNVDKVNVIIGSVASSNVAVTKAGEYVSRICFIDDFQGMAMAKFAFNDLKAKKAAIVKDSAQDYSIGLAKAFKETFEKLGGQIVVEVSYQSKDQDFSSQLTKVKVKKPDVLFVPGYYQEVGNMIRQAKQFGISAKFLGGDGWSGQELFDLGGEAIVGHYFSSHFSDEDTDPKVQEFVKKYNAAQKIAPNDMAALGYDSIYVVADAVRRNGMKTDAEGMMKAINATKGFAGVTGVITLDKDRNASKPLVILETQRNRAGFKQRVNP